MSTTRNNHYVPKWYQEGFFQPNQNTLAYLDLAPELKKLSDGRSFTEKALFYWNTSRCFQKKDLYSTFFGTTVNDEIERRLFGDIDRRGARAVRAFQGTDISEWHEHFQTLFEYIDIQKLRTPKGLDWLRAQYPRLSQNELMGEMQGIRMMHCAIWAGGVREIVSAEDAEVKFIATDHPVTIYNHAAAPSDKLCQYPDDPSTVLKGSQTIFPLSRDHCLIFTNLEYAQDPSTDPLQKRTFARKFQNSLARTDNFIRTRRLSNDDVARINFVLKSRARRYVAAGKKEWLYPEQNFSGTWRDLKETLLPPGDELWKFGGKIFVGYDGGEVDYQDEFGRKEEEREFLKKEPPSKPLRANDLCGCGSGRAFGVCCRSKPEALRPTWNEQSIRERNLMFFRALHRVLDLSEGRDWLTVRRELTDEKISKVYHLFEGLWPLETDIFQLLPKPDGAARAIYTGSIHPDTIGEFVLGASLYFGELIILHPFVHAGAMAKKISPVEHPTIYRQEFLKAVQLFLRVAPLVEIGLVNLVPDPCNFDAHLNHQIMGMAQARAAVSGLDYKKDARLVEQAEQDGRRSMLALPRSAWRSMIRKHSPELTKDQVNDLLRSFDFMREQDPLVVLQEWKDGKGDDRGLMNMMKLAPNFELALYMAQATGASIVTDSISRWEEIQIAMRRRRRAADSNLPALTKTIEAAAFKFPQDVMDIALLSATAPFSAYSAVMGNAFRYVSKLGDRGPKPNVEAGLNASFSRTHASAQALIAKSGVPIQAAKMKCAFPVGGIQDNTVNRLLLMSNAEIYLPDVPMAFYIQA